MKVAAVVFVAVLIPLIAKFPKNRCSFIPLAKVVKGIEKMLSGLETLMLGAARLCFFGSVVALLLPAMVFGDGIVNLYETGQTSCYDELGALISCAGTGQDGEIQAGTSWVLPFTSGSRFTDQGDGTVLDNLTVRRWLKDGDCLGGGWDAGLTKVGWANTDPDFLESLRATCTEFTYEPSPTDTSLWRLPNISDLESLFNAEVPDQIAWMESVGFVDVQLSYVSSTTYVPMPFGPEFVWYSPTAFGGGALFPASKPGGGGALMVRDDPVAIVFGPPAKWQTGQTTCYDTVGAVIACDGSDQMCFDTQGTVIPCPRTGQDGDLQAGVPWPSPRFTDIGDGTVFDELTGLNWLKDANCIDTEYPGFNENFGGAVTWQHALDFVQGINNGTYPDCGAGHSDWRLPNRRELHSLTDFSQSNPALPPGHPFINVQNNVYWSSTTQVDSSEINSTANAWSIRMWSGELTWVSKIDNGQWVLPVRGGVAAPVTGNLLPAVLLLLED